jgi:hypothetical protein
VTFQHEHLNSCQHLADCVLLIRDALCESKQPDPNCRHTYCARPADCIGCESENPSAQYRAEGQDLLKSSARRSRCSGRAWGVPRARRRSGTGRRSGRILQALTRSRPPRARASPQAVSRKPSRQEPRERRPPKAHRSGRTKRRRIRLTTRVAGSLRDDDERCIDQEQEARLGADRA